MNALRKALRIAEKVYQDFLEQVVEQHVLRDRVRASSKKELQNIQKGHIDTRPVHMMSISGKGGYHPDGRYRACINITLLDHDLSVVRGSLVFAAYEVASADPDFDPAMLEKALRGVAAIAFIHDVDKDLGLERGIPLDPQTVEERWRHYGLDTFASDWNLDAEQILYLIERVEATQAHRTRPATLPPQGLSRFTDVIGLADKLDGLWCCKGPQEVIERLQKTPVLQHLKHWRLIQLYDPHHPFLMDEYLRWLSAFCRKVNGVPPLLEIHHDGLLVALIPDEQGQKVLKEALDAFIKHLEHRLRWYLNISDRNVPEILEGYPDHRELIDYFARDIEEKTLQRLMVIQASRKDRVAEYLDAQLDPIGLAPRWPMKVQGQTLSLYASLRDMTEEARKRLGQAAHLAALLKHKEVKGFPKAKEREQVLIGILGEPPVWIKDISDNVSRRTLLALWAVAKSVGQPDKEKAIWGEDGLLKQWLGKLHKIIPYRIPSFLKVMRKRFQTLMGLEALNMPETGKRCILTDLPVDPKSPIRDSDHLYGISISAFSGREGRLETLQTDRAETYVEPVSYVEYHLRHRIRPDPMPKMPVLISSPTTTGLFAALVMNDEQDYAHLSVYDLARQDPKKGQVYRGMEIYRGRYRIARYETMPRRLADQVNLIRLLLQACLRIGRPIHVFRGLPTLQRAFFYFDALPKTLWDLIRTPGGQGEFGGLRLEEILKALERLGHAQTILTTQGLGLEVFNLYARPATRLAAVALTWAKLRDDSEKGSNPWPFEQAFLQLIEDPLMTENYSPVVHLGHLAATIQRRPRGMASANEEMMTFNLAMDAAIDAWRMGLRDRDSLIHAIAGELETNLTRKDLAAAKSHRAGKTLREGCQELAKYFVDHLWFGLMKGRPPTQRQRRIYGAIYRMAFLNAPRREEASPETVD